MDPIFLVSDADYHNSTDVDGEKNHNRNTIEDFTEEIDEAEFVRQYNFFHLLTRMNLLFFCSYEPFAQCCAPIFWLCEHGGINNTLGREVGLIVTGRRPSP